MNGATQDQLNVYARDLGRRNDEFRGLVRTSDGTETGEVLCAYRPGCPNRATTAIPNPVLGQVPACDDCAAFVARMEAPR